MRNRIPKHDTGSEKKNRLEDHRRNQDERGAARKRNRRHIKRNLMPFPDQLQLARSNPFVPGKGPTVEIGDCRCLSKEIEEYSVVGEFCHALFSINHVGERVE